MVRLLAKFVEIDLLLICTADGLKAVAGVTAVSRVLLACQRDLFCRRGVQVEDSDVFPRTQSYIAWLSVECGRLLRQIPTSAVVRTGVLTGPLGTLLPSMFAVVALNMQSLPFASNVMRLLTPLWGAFEELRVTLAADGPNVDAASMTWTIGGPTFNHSRVLLGLVCFALPAPLLSLLISARFVMLTDFVQIPRRS
jgi:hypothetical protein